MNQAHAINILGTFCGVRDFSELSPSALYTQTGLRQADVMVLFGGSILCGGDVLAEAIQSGIAKKYMIVGGAGHTTPVLRDKMHTFFSEMETENRSEADLFNQYLKLRYGLSADLLETQSTNCGNNITNMLAALDSNHIPCESIILAQDATMQRRMAEGLRLLRPGIRITNYATYQAEVVEQDGQLRFKDEIMGMWSMDHYVELLLGEIKRLRDDGYGPKGKGFIAHVDIPIEVEAAFEQLSEVYTVRKANQAFA